MLWGGGWALCVIELVLFMFINPDLISRDTLTFHLALTLSQMLQLIAHLQICTILKIVNLFLFVIYILVKFKMYAYSS